VDVFLVEKEGVAVVAFVLVERLAVVAVNHPDRVLLQPARAQAFDEGAERGVPVVQSVAVLIDILRSGKWAALGSGVRVMAGDGQVGEEETLPERQGVDPGKHTRDRGRFVDAETRTVVAADIAGVFERPVAAVADDRLHAQICEAAGMEHGRAVTGVRENLGDRAAVDLLILFGTAVEGGKGGAQHREEALDTLRVDGVGVFENQSVLRQRAEMGHHVVVTAVEREVLRGGGFQADHHHVMSSGNAFERREIFRLRR